MKAFFVVVHLLKVNSFHCVSVIVPVCFSVLMSAHKNLRKLREATLFCLKTSFVLQ